MVASTAFRLKISFHGRRGSRKPRLATAKSIKAAAKLTNPTPYTAVNGKAAPKSVVERRMQRRCPACNDIFEPTQISDYLCDNCDNGSYAAK